MKAHDFNLQDQDGQWHKLAYYRGKWLILYFYPKDDTPGCTKEACSFRDSMSALELKGVSVLGVSQDTVESHKAFAAKYNLRFPLLSDTSTDVIKAYDAWGNKTYPDGTFTGVQRMTYIIDPKGEIVKTYKEVDPAKHIDEIMRDLETLQGGSGN